MILCGFNHSLPYYAPSFLALPRFATLIAIPYAAQLPELLPVYDVGKRAALRNIFQRTWDRLAFWRTSPQAYRIFLDVAGQKHERAFDDRNVVRSARQWRWRSWRRDVVFELPSGESRLLMGAEPIAIAELPQDAGWPPFLIFDLEKPKGDFTQQSALVVRTIGEQSEQLSTQPIRFDQPRTLLVPMSDNVRAILMHIRLNGKGVLPPLRVKMSAPSRTAVNSHNLARMVQQFDETGGEADLVGRSETYRSISIGENRRFAWSAIMRRAGSPDHKYSAGILSASLAEDLGSFQQLRVDEDLADHSPTLCGSFIFEDRAAEEKFGWQGVMTPGNNYANAALARYLAHARKNAMRTVLIAGEQSRAKPLFEAFAEQFDAVAEPDQLEAALRGSLHSQTKADDKLAEA